jgi:DegV family protein with EDD domain
MKIRYLDGPRLYHAFLAGGQAVIRDREELDRINVFPVPDADTGTNLAATMRAIFHRARAAASVRTTLDSIADAALTGARGNSGLIFAQFLYGLSRGVRDDLRLTTRQFGESVRRAVDDARRAIATPVEGTLLTVLRDWAESVYAERLKRSDFSELLGYSLRIAEQSLEETPKKLAILARAGVVDAGAKGFIDFLQGVADFIRGGSLRHVARLRLEAEAPPALPNAHQRPLSRRYCSEALLTANGLDLDLLRAAIRDLGDSVIVAGSETKARLHIHTDDSAEVFERAGRFGTMVEIKVDDMLRQYEVAHARRSPIALVTDSSCDLPPEVLDEHQIHVIPFTISFGDSNYLDKLTLKPARFYELLRRSPVMPRSAMPSPAAVRERLALLATHYDEIIVVTISSRLSGLHGQVLAARKEFPETKIAVIDSHHLSNSLGLLVLRMAEAVRAGRSFDELVTEAPAWADKTRIWVDVRTLEYMVRGGRVSPLKGLLAKVLNIKPIISLDAEGRAAPTGKSFSRRSNFRKILGLVKRETASGDVWNYSLVHAASPDRASLYAERLTSLLGRPPLFSLDLAPVVGVHNGPGAVAVALMKE